MLQVYRTTAFFFVLFLVILLNPWLCVDEVVGATVKKVSKIINEKFFGIKVGNYFVPITVSLAHVYD